MYRIIIERRAIKELEAVSGDMVQSIIDTIHHLKFNPRPYNTKKLIGEDGWRIRVRDHRILYTINDSQKIVTIYRIKHRREAYR